MREMYEREYVFKDDIIDTEEDIKEEIITFLKYLLIYK